MNDKPAILAIEDLKWFPERYLGRASRVFLSSGTGRSRRSRSPFSDEGLVMYRTAALEGFFASLKRHGLGKAPGISLIPQPSEWPDSSLAQMLAWIGEETEVFYADPKSLASLLSAQTQTLWLFGTNAQWMTLFADGFESPLPQHSLVFETGGSKGLVEDLPVELVHQRIADMFRIDSCQVISEYGMCELASQAYNDFSHESQRVYRFGEGVKLHISDDHEELHTSGLGCLVVSDPYRVDLASAIRTQDLVELFEDQSFRMIGRLIGAPIKGCSLLSVLPPSQKADATQIDHLRQLQLDSDLSKTTMIESKLMPLIGSALTDLAEEVGSHADAETLWRRIMQSLPKDSWRPSLERAIGSSSLKRSAKSWLFIPPGNHSLAMLYPFIMAIALDFKLYVRTPRLNTSMKFFDHIIHSINTLFPTQLTLLPHQFNIGVDEIPSDVEAIFTYGSDATVQGLRSLSGLPLKAFGERICVGICRAHELGSLRELIIDDAFLLQQRGCMSLRWLYVVDDSTCKDVEENHIKDLAISPQQLSYGHRIALAHEKRRLEMLCPGSYSYLAQRLINVQTSDEPQFDPELLSTAPGVLVIQKIRSSKLTQIIEHFPSVNLILCSPEFSHVDFGVEQRAFGDAHFYPWDGSYQGLSLFGF